MEEKKDDNLIPELECQRCHYKWIPRKKKISEVFCCPSCKTALWRIPISEGKRLGRKRKIR